MTRISRVKEIIERNHRESLFKTLAAKVSKFWKYTDEDKRDLWEMYKKDTTGVLEALKAQERHINAMAWLKQATLANGMPKVGSTSHGQI